VQGQPSSASRAKICPECGGEYFPEEVQGLCPRCLRRMLLRLDAEEPDLQSESETETNRE